MSRSLENRQSSRAVAGVALLLALTNLGIVWPGTLTPDSRTQLGQVMNGAFTDWHPPLMAEIWSLLGGSVPAMLGLQVGLHWLGFWGLAESLRRDGVGKWAWAMLAVGLTPIAIKYTGVIQKDTLLASFFISAFGLAAVTRGHWLALVLGGAGSLCSANGVFALPPLVLMRLKEMKRLPAAGLCLVGAALLIPISGVVNHDVLQAERTGVERSLQLFDLAGIAHFSGDPGILPLGTERAQRCYTPLFWDPLVGPDCVGPLKGLPASLTGAWVHAIARHPIAYATHRIAHFNKTIFFVVPPMQQCVDAPSYHQCDFSRRGLVVDFLTKNALLWPVTWLAIGFMLLFGELHPVSRAITMSGLLYGSAYLLVGVAADFRYFYWTELAVQAAIVFQLGQTGRLPRWKLVAGSVAAVWLVGYSARLAML